MDTLFPGPVSKLAQLVLADHQLQDVGTDKMRFETAAGGFDFG